MILNEEHVLIQQAARDIVEREIAPYAAEADEQTKFPLHQLQELAKLDMLLLNCPEEYGGGGGDKLAYAILQEEISKECPATGTSVAVHALTADCIKGFGTEEQKKKYLSKMATGEWLGGFSLTEPGAGSDAAGLQTVAVDKGDHYIVNGTKTFATSGDYCEFLVVVVKTDIVAPGTKGMTALLIHKDQFKVGKHEEKMGLRGSHTVEIILQDAVVPKESVLGELGKGFRVAMASLDGGRIGIAAQSTGIMQALLDESIKYSKERVQFGKPLAANQAIQWMMANMYRDVNAARQLTYHACTLADAALPYGPEAAAAKLFASEAAMQHAINAVQIQGGYGYCKPAKVERLFRDAKITSIYEGSSEVQRMVIANSILR